MESYSLYLYRVFHLHRAMILRCNHPIECINNLLISVFFLAAPCRMWDLSSLASDPTRALGSGSSES